MGSGSNPAGEYECVDVRRSHRDGVEHADVSQFTERAEPVHRLGGYTEACSDPLYGEQRPHPSASCLWSCLLACPMPSPECLQDCGGIGGLARNPADIGLPRNLLRLRANRRIGVCRRPVSNLLLENSSPVHPANFRQGSRQLAELPFCVSRMSPNRPPTSRRLPERTSRNCARQIPCTPALLASAIVCRLIRDDRVEASPALPSARLRAPGSHLGSPRPGSRFPTGSWFRRSISRREPRQWAR